jgi:hypothetical protein
MPRTSRKRSPADRGQQRSQPPATTIAWIAAQEPAWDKVAEAMRQDVQEYDDAVRRLPNAQTPPNAIDSLTQRSIFASLRAKGEQRFLDVFRPLYDSLSPQQKAAADDLFATRDDPQ